jgi:hypothetical protein
MAMTDLDRDAELRALARDLAYVANLWRGRGLGDLAEALRTAGEIAIGKIGADQEDEA